MADTKISDLTALTGANVAADDEFVIVDTSAAQSKRITKTELAVALGTNDTLADVLGKGNTTGGTDIAVSTGDDITFADSSKAIFGAGSDLQIYHDGSNSYIDDAGQGWLNIRGATGGVSIEKYTGEVMAQFSADGYAQLRYDNATKLQTTSTGIDVTGTVTADGLTVDGDGYFGGTTVAGTDYPLRIQNKDTGVAAGVGIEFSIDSVNDVIGSTIRSDRTGAAYHQSALTFSTRRANGSGLVDAAKIDQNGDISFYDSTGTSQNLFWDASASRLGIGNTVPLGKLTISNAAGATAPTTVTAANTYLQLGSDDFGPASNGKFMIGFGYTDATNTNSPAYIGFEESSNSGDTKGSLTFYTRDVITDTAPSQRMIIDSSGNVGINTNTPSSYTANGNNLVVADVNVGITLASTSASGSGALYFADGTTGSEAYRGIINYLHASDAMGFHTGAAERMRLDSSGNLLVGTTDSNPVGNNVDSGVQLGDGRIRASRVDRAVLELNRKTSDGSIAEFRKNGTTVGSIGTASGNAYIGSGDTGIAFSAADDTVYPITTATGGIRDAAIDLGGSAYRYKDLYLSGGVYLGGTSSSNRITQYEQGTWTPTFTGSSSNPTVSYALQNGRYTRIGRLVYANFILIASGTPSGGSGNLRISGLPFAISANNLQPHGFPGIVNNISIDMTSNQIMFAGPTDGVGYYEVYRIGGSTTSATSNLTVSAIYNSGARIDGTLVYEVYGA